MVIFLTIEVHLFKLLTVRSLNLSFRVLVRNIQTVSQFALKHLHTKNPHIRSKPQSEVNPLESCGNPNLVSKCTWCRSHLKNIVIENQSDSREPKQMSTGCNNINSCRLVGHVWTQKSDPWSLPDRIWFPLDLVWGTNVIYMQSTQKLMCQSTFCKGSTKIVFMSFLFKRKEKRA